METGYLNLHDGEHFSTNTSPLYEDMLDDSDGSLLDMIRDEFSSYGVGVSRSMHDTPDLWETEQELNGDMAVLPVAVPLDGSLGKLESQTKEDFQKMLIDWQEHLGSMQVSDSEEMDVKDIVGMDMVMPKHISEHLPEDIFEDDAAALDTTTTTTSSPSSFKKGTSDVKSELGLGVKEEFGISIKEEFGNHCLQNFMDEEDDDLGLKVAEEDTANCSNDKQTVSEENASDVPSKAEPDEDCVDVETVTEQIPVLEAGDLKSLLEQFEASEAFNSTSTGCSKSASVLDSHLYAMATQQLKPSTSSPTTPVKGSAGSLSHQNIRDSLPQEVIDRIKASGRKRVIPVIPAIPTKRHGRGGTRMQDAGVTLSRNKLLKIVSSGSSGESVQLDHDYCTTSSASNGSDVAPPRSFYHSDASEYQGDKSNNTSETAEKQKGKFSGNGKDNIYSRLPEYYMVLAPQKANENKKVSNSAPREDECWGENSSKKDSGLESGEVSDASEETPALPPETVRIKNSSVTESSNNKDLVAVTIKAPSSICGKNIVSVNGRDYHIASSANNKGPESIRINHCGQTATTKPVKEMAMVSVLKKCHIGASANPSNSSLPVPSNSANRESAGSEEVKLLKVENQQQGPKKKKLNLEQYRSRLKELDRIRGSRESSRASSPVSSVCSVSVGTSMVEGCTSDAKSSASENIPVKCELPAANVKCDNSEASQRVMCSVEVQTVPEKEAEQQKEKEKQAAHSRDRRRRHYRSRRTSSSSSSSSSSSGSSSSSSRDRRHRSRSSRSKRRKPSHRHSSKGRSTSSLESHSQSIWSRSRSQSVTSSSAKSSCSSRSARSRSRSRSNGSKRYFRSPDRRRHFIQRGREIRWSGRNFSSGPEWRRSRSPLHMNRPLSGDWQLTEREKQRQVEERRVIYVGRIEEGTTKADLRRRFEVFGPIIDISVHFREHGDNYGFVTFQYKVDAYEAVEHGNDDPNMPRYDLCFGGRRAFCKTRYADLDGMANNDPLGEPAPYKRPIRPQNNEDSFDLLLREAQAKLRKRKA